MALAELQATEALKFRLYSFQSAEMYLSEMRQQFSNAGENFTHLSNMCF